MDEYREIQAERAAALAALDLAIPVFVVRRFGGTNAEGPVEILSAWTDMYTAKFEAQRWEQDSKRKHDYVKGRLVIP